MSGYITIHDATAPGRQTVSQLLIAGCVCACIVVGALLVGNSNALYSASKVQPSTTTFNTPAPTMRSLGTPARAPLNAQSEPSRTSIFTVPNASPMRAVVGGFVFAAFASLSAFILNRLGNQKVQSKFLEAEANWSMAAATAFIGTKAPDFKATAVFDQEFTDIQLSQYKGKKYVVLFFYPLDFTFVCPTEITAFSDRAAEFEATGTQILGVSVDSQFSHLAWIQTPRSEGGLGELKYPLVADLKKEIAESYGVLTEDGVALRGLFIIDKEGVIQHATINNLAFGRNVDETLRTLEALQYVQANPDEVCPAGWKKGDKTMKPDPTGSKEYFKAL